MKISYLNAVTIDFIKKLNYVPLMNKNGNPVIYLNQRMFEKRDLLTHTVVEIIDADRLSVKDMHDCETTRVGWYDNLNSTNFNEDLIFVQVLVFFSRPSKEKLQSVNSVRESVFKDRKIEIIVVETQNKEIFDLTGLRFAGYDITGVLAGRLDEDLKGYDELPDLQSIVNYQEPEHELKETTEKTPAVFVFLGINVLVWVLGQAFLLIYEQDFIFMYGVKYNPLIIRGEYWRLLTPVFLHADFMHLFTNSFSLLIFGPVIERIFGTWKFVLLYLFTGITGNIASFIFSESMSLGASGAVLGIGGAMVFLWWRKRSMFYTNKRKYLILVFLAFLNVFYGFLRPGIDNYAHLGGFAGGIGLSRFLYRE